MIKPAKYPKLFSIVFGEGMINDAVAIILFKVVGDIFDHEVTDSVGILLLTILWKFVVNVAASLAIGAACGMIYVIFSFALFEDIPDVSFSFS